ncbi:uncharacterized protein LOC117315965 [Pecten maximus]|uniref:uncharacterized protein LOC117315965 n=1 Tax=Pecten maximus TaxID=6579 RepID=UPI001458E27D|nr:uncharacterized protein LOC117315965 [Pecten maximus]
MATKRKYNDEDGQNSCTGYIHDVSPIKRSKANNPYFEGTIQTADRQYQRLVCFDTNKHGTLQAAATSKTPLKLSSIKQSPSRADSTKSDVVINQSSTLELKVRKLDFDHYAMKKQTGTTPTPIKTIVEQIPEYNKVTIAGKVASIGEPIKQEVRGLNMTKQDVIIADQTDFINLTVWNNMVDSLLHNHHYILTNLTTRNFNNTKTLTTTVSTTVQELEEVPTDLKNVVNVDMDLAPVSQKIVGEISQVMIAQSKICNACKKKVGDQMCNEHSTFFRCCFCNMKQKSSSLKTSMSGTLNITTAEPDGKSTKVAIFHNVLMEFLKELNKTDLLNNANLLEEYLLELESVSITYGKDNVVQKMRT